MNYIFMNPIKQLIEYEKITQKEFSEKIDVRQQYVNKLINGNVGMGASIIRKIAVQYPNVNLRWLLGFPGEDMFIDKEGGSGGTASYKIESIIRYLYENNDVLLEDSLFREFIRSNIEVLNIEKEQEALEEKKAEIKATLQEKLKNLKTDQ